MDLYFAARSPAQFLFTLLWLVLIAWSVIARLDFDYNSLYMDESGYLFAGSLMLQGDTWPTRGYVFSSDLPLLVLALMDQVLPTFGPRALAFLATLSGSLCIFVALRRLCIPPDASALAAGLIFMIPASMIVGQLATYDSLCFLVCCGAIFGAVITQQQPSFGSRALFAAMCCTAVMMKYIAIAFVPVAVLWIALTQREYLVSFTLMLLTPLVSYLAFNAEPLNTLLQTQIFGIHKANGTRADIALQIGLHLMPLILTVAVLYFWCAQRRSIDRITKIRLLTLGALFLPLPVYHLITLNTIALHKHMIYPGLALILVGVVLCGKSATSRNRQLWVATILAAVLAPITHQLQRAHSSAWPDSRAMIATLSEQLHPATTILSEDPYLVRYHFKGRLALSQIQDTNWLDFDGDGHHDPSDVVAAVSAGAFDFIYLNDLLTPALNQSLRTGPLAEHYDAAWSSQSKLSGLASRAGQNRQTLYQRKLPVAAVQPSPSAPELSHVRPVADFPSL